MDAERDNQNRWRKLKDIFNEAVELTPESRASYLASLRLDEETLYRELAELIDIDRKAEDFLGEPISLKSDSFSPPSLIGERIGHYKIVREIERGGMGAVFEAVRFDGEFEQRVAVKLVNRNFFSDELIKRFKKERQILAKLEHPNIVRLLDGGFTRDKTPYYVMEFIEGTPINVYCRENELDTEQRLNLFLQVCEAVAYAHRQLIVHRDLKPSNILVTKNEQAKLLDFGIAKILEADTDAQTQTQNAPLTPAYASPEQIKGETITTASDVFSLGAILYELLTEKSPHEIYGVGRMEILRGICETEPKPPSAAVGSKFKVQSSKRGAETSENNNQQNVSIQQTTNPKSKIQNPKSLKGDLDNIVLKALQKEKERRYNSVEQFADDIKNYLNGLPVKAHPQSFEYRAGKFIKRNRPAVSLAAIAVLLIVGGVCAALWQSFEVRRQQQIAERNFNQVRKIANSLIFDYHDEIAKLEGSTKLREKLVVDAVNYLDAVSSENAASPEFLKESAIAYRKIGDVEGKPYAANLGKLDEALLSYEKSVNLLEKSVSLAPADIALKDELLNSYNALAQALSRSGKKAEAEIIIRKAMAFCEEIPATDDNLDRQILFLRMRTTLGDVQSTLPPKYEIYKSALDAAESLYSSNQDNTELIRTIHNLTQRLGTLFLTLGNGAQKNGDTNTANDYYRQSLEYNRQELHYVEIFFARGGSGAKSDVRLLYAANANVAAVLFRLKGYDEALKNLDIADRYVQEALKNDPNNRESVLDKIELLNTRIQIFTAQSKSDAALKEINVALALAEEFYRRDKSNTQAIWWVGRLSADAVDLLRNQKKEREAEKYRQMLLDCEKQYKENFGTHVDFKAFIKL
jgi:non-specific serine/threonine protein kinase/serine/threonine-protein kinase